jgi:hypothetical protein
MNKARTFEGATGRLNDRSVVALDARRVGWLGPHRPLPLETLRGVAERCGVQVERTEDCK